MPIFNGTSRFSADFSQVMDRALAIAALPKSQLERQKTDLSSQQSAWTALQGKFTSLRSSLTAFTSAVGSSGVTAVSTDSAVARPTTAAGVLQGVYTVEVLDIGAKTTALGLTGVANPATEALASAASFTLISNGVSTVITPEAMTLTSLVDAINKNTAAGVSATLVNVASSGSPASYRLSLQSSLYSLNPIELSYEDAGTQQLLGTPTLGSAVTYRINGFPVVPASPIASNSRTVSISPGLTIAVGKVGVADVTVNRSPTTLTTAISSFVAAYNASVDQVDLSRGESAGVLKGQSSVSLLSSALRKTLAYTGSGEVSSAADIGIEFGSDGKLTFDSSVITSMSTNQLASVATFLGNGTTNGFLKSAASALSDADSSSFGVLSSEIAQLTIQQTAKQKAIDESQRRIDDLQTSLAAKMSAADALIASLEQQVSYFTGMFEAMRANSNNY